MKLPKFKLPASDGKNYSEKDFQKGIFVLYLYPKDSTSGCTLEAQNFRELKDDFKKLKVRIFGLSKDSLKSHDNFFRKQSLNFALLSDQDIKLIDALGAWQEKKIMGRTYMGVVRSTFVIKDGEIVKEWRNVKVKNHADETLDFCKKII